MARSKSSVAASPVRKQKLGAVTEVTMKTAQNGYVVTARDKDYNSKDYIARSASEATKIMKTLSGGK